MIYRLPAVVAQVRWHHQSTAIIGLKPTAGLDVYRLGRGVRMGPHLHTTPHGEQALEEARAKIAELVAEVLQGEGPASLTDEDAPQA